MTLPAGNDLLRDQLNRARIIHERHVEDRLINTGVAELPPQLERLVRRSSPSLRIISVASVVFSISS